MRKSSMVIAALALAACGKSGRDADPAAPSAQAAATDQSAAPAASGIDPCTLVADPPTLFGTPVTAGNTSTTGTTTCEWKSEDGRICGSLTLFKPAANSSPDPKVNYAGLVASLGAFGQVQDVPGIGEEARMVDGGMLGAQVAFRTAREAALAVSACRSGPYGQTELAPKLAREVVGKL